MSDFDPYYFFLGIPPKEQPPNYYRLLGIELVSKEPGVVLGKARVEIDGELIALAELEEPIELSADEHEIHVEGMGFEAVTERFVVTRGENDKLVITLKQAVASQVPSSTVATDTKTNTDKVATANLVKVDVSKPDRASETNVTHITNTPPSTRLEVRAVATLAGHEDKVTSAKFSTDGNMVISSSADKTVRYWDVAGQRLVAALTGHTGVVSGVDISPDGRQAISCSSDETVRLWDLETHEEVRVLMGHNSYVRDIAFAPDGQHALSGADGSNLFYWDIKGDGHNKWKASGATFHVCISANGKTALTTDYFRTDVRVWDVETASIEGMFTNTKDESERSHSQATGAWLRQLLPSPKVYTRKFTFGTLRRKSCCLRVRKLGKLTSPRMVGCCL